MSTESDHLQELRAEARYARERYDLYRAKAYGSRPTSATRMRELARRSELARRRLQVAESEPPVPGEAPELSPPAG